VNTKNRFGDSLLHKAARSGQVSTNKRLLEEGANVNISDNNGWTPLHEACHYGHTVVASLLIDHDADMSKEGGDERETPLVHAAISGQLNVVKLLVKKGAAQSG